MMSDGEEVFVRETGSVNWFDTERRYGFIKRDETGDDIFVHLTEIKQAGLDVLHPNDRVSFIPSHSPRKDGQLCATDLMLVVS